MVGGGADGGGQAVVTGQNTAPARLQAVGKGGGNEWHRDGRDHDPRALDLGEIRHRGGLGARCQRRQHPHHKADHRNNRPCPTGQHREQQYRPHARLHLAGAAQTGVQPMRFGARRIGRGKAGQRHQRHHHRHHHVNMRPAHPRGHDQGQRPPDDGGRAIAKLPQRGQQFQRRIIVRHVDPPCIDDDILRGGGEGRDKGDKGEIADGETRIGGRQPQKPQCQNDLAQQDPAAPAAHPLQQRQRHPVHQRRPQEFERIGEANPRQHADGGQLDAHLAQPCVQRADQQRKRQPRRKAQPQHTGRLAGLQRGGQQGESLWAGR